MRHRAFNMIELMLAMAAIMIGVTAIMGLFAVGANAGRDTMALSTAADSADYLLGWYAEYAQPDWTRVTDLPIIKPGVSEPPAWTAVPATPFEYGGVNDEYWRITVGDDFSGVCRLWRTAIEASYWDGVQWVAQPIAETRGVALHFEVSWPSQMPYPRRKTALYYREVWNDEQ